MKILVCISSTPETTAVIKFSEDNKRFISENVNYIMNPFDEWFALVKALEIKEQVGGHITLIHIGGQQNDKIIRKGLAIGADDAVRINIEAKSSRFVADQISAYAKENEFDLIFTGKETLDHNGAEVGGMTAELLGLPFISYASKLNLDEGLFEIERDIEGGVEVLEVSAPFVLSASKGLAEQRIPNMRGIMMAKRKPLNVIEAYESNSENKLISFTLPESKAGVHMIDAENVDELVRLLHEEAKVI